MGACAAVVEVGRAQRGRGAGRRSAASPPARGRDDSRAVAAGAVVRLECHGGRADRARRGGRLRLRGARAVGRALGRLRCAGDRGPGADTGRRDGGGWRAGRRAHPGRLGHDPEPGAGAGAGGGGGRRDRGPRGRGGGAAPPGPRAAASGSESGASGSESGAAEIVVHVVGQVVRPGLVRLRSGARVADAVAAAGGARPGADVAALNLARLVVDGEQLHVPKPGEEVTPPAAAPGGGDGGSGGGDPGSDARGREVVVSLNAADLSTLDTLPGVGPVLAQRIIDWRAEHGRFTSVDELGEVSGIGDKLLAQLRPRVSL